MQPKEVTVKNGSQITIATAGANDFIPGDPIPEGVTVDVHCGWDFKKKQSHFARQAPLFAAWHRAQARALGTDSSLILAWQEQHVVGFLSFCVAGDRIRQSALELPGDFCPYVEQSKDLVEEINSMPVEKMDFDTITITCAFSVTPRLKRQGIATAMLRYLIEYAREQAWKHIRAAGRLPEKDDGFWPAEGLLKAVGFYRVGECVELPGETPGYEMRLDL